MRRIVLLICLALGATGCDLSGEVSYEKARKLFRLEAMKYQARVVERDYYRRQRRDARDEQRIQLLDQKVEVKEREVEEQRKLVEAAREEMNEARQRELHLRRAGRS